MESSLIKTEQVKAHPHPTTATELGGKAFFPPLFGGIKPAWPRIEAGRTSDEVCRPELCKIYHKYNTSHDQ